MREIPRRRGLAPFVGAALAALTAGSLVTFSVIAQRTSLDGMSDDRVIAESPPAATQPPAITIAPRDDGAGEVDGRTTETIAEPSGVIPAAPLLNVAGPIDEGPSGATTLIASDDPTVAPPSDTDRLGGLLAAEEAFLARTGGGAPVDTGIEDERAGYDGRHDGEHTHKSHQVKAKSNRSANAESKKTKRSARHGRSANRRRGRGDPKGGSSSGRSPHAGGSAAPAQRASSSKSKPAPTARKSSPSRRPASNSKSRGRGRH